MATEVVTAGEIGWGDEIEVDLGKGKTFRPVDKADHIGEEVTITLYSSFGRRPVLRLNRNLKVVRRKGG